MEWTNNSTFRTTEKADGQIKDIVVAASKGSPQNAAQIVDCLETTYRQILGDPTIGTPAESAYDGSRMVNLHGYDGFLVIFIIEEGGPRVVGFIHSWMAGL